MRLDTLHVLLGMGLGSFPREYYVAHASSAPTARRIDSSGMPRSERHYLVLTGGRGMYMDQRVAARPGSELRLRGQVRSPQTGAKLSISLCDKVIPEFGQLRRGSGLRGSDVATLRGAPLVASTRGSPASHRRHRYRCHFITAPSARAWRSRNSRSWMGRPSLLSNGSFEHGLDRWFVASDVHLAWRVHNTPLQIAFEQGALGILAWLVLCIAAIAVVLRPSASPVLTAAFAAAGIGFLVVGCFDSLLDSPRVILLVALIGAVRAGRRRWLQVHPYAPASRPPGRARIAPTTDGVSRHWRRVRASPTG